MLPLTLASLEPGVARMHEGELEIPFAPEAVEVNRLG
jgi:hypothetical protein